MGNHSFCQFKWIVLFLSKSVKKIGCYYYYWLSISQLTKAVCLTLDGRSNTVTAQITPVSYEQREPQKLNDNSSIDQNWPEDSWYLYITIHVFIKRVQISVQICLCSPTLFLSLNLFDFPNSWSTLIVHIRLHAHRVLLQKSDTRKYNLESEIKMLIKALDWAHIHFCCYHVTPNSFPSACLPV